jgi:hypothetical protein
VRSIEPIARAREAAITQEQAAGRLPRLLLTDAEAEQVTGLCAKTLKARGLKPVYVGRAKRWRLSDLEAWCQSLRHEPECDGGQAGDTPATSGNTASRGSAAA